MGVSISCSLSSSTLKSTIHNSYWLKSYAFHTANRDLRVSFSMPPHILTTLAKGLLMGKILASCPATIPLNLNNEDRTCIEVTDDINKAIKATARTITRTKLSDKIRSEDVLKKADLKCLNESVGSIIATTVWKTKQSMNPIGKRLFQERTIPEDCPVLRSQSSKNIRPPVPGYPNLALNIMAKVWNDIPELQSAKTLGGARTISHNLDRKLPR